MYLLFIRNIILIIFGPVAIMMAWYKWQGKFHFSSSMKIFWGFPLIALATSFSVAVLGVCLALRENSDEDSIKHRLVLMGQVALIFVLPATIIDFNFYNDFFGLAGDVKSLYVMIVAYSTGIGGIQIAMRKSHWGSRATACVAYIVCGTLLYFVMNGFVMIAMEPNGFP